MLLTEEEICTHYVCNGLTMRQVAKLAKTRACNVKKVLQKHGVRLNVKNVDTRKYDVCDTVFDSITAAEQAYWLGFLAADGCVIESKKIAGKVADRIQLSLGAVDIDHLHKFIKFVEYSGPIYYRKAKALGKEYPSVKVCFTSKQIGDALGRQGVVPRKTAYLSPPILREELVPHYIRGFFDGDGSWCLTTTRFTPKEKTYSYTKLHCRVSCQSVEFVKWFQFELERAGIKTRTYKAKNIWDVHVASEEDRQRFYNYIYEEASVFLGRKKEKAEKFYGN